MDLFVKYIMTYDHLNNVKKVKSEKYINRLVKLIKLIINNHDNW